MGKDKQVEEALVKWFSRVRDQEARITQEMLLVKSEQLAKLLGHSNFKASRGCLYHLCKRSDMKHRKLREESASADLVAREISSSLKPGQPIEQNMLLRISGTPMRGHT